MQMCIQTYRNIIAAISKPMNAIMTVAIAIHHSTVLVDHFEDVGTKDVVYESLKPA